MAFSKVPEDKESKSTSEFLKQIAELDSKLQAIHNYSTSLGAKSLPTSGLFGFMKQGDDVIAENLDRVAEFVTQGEFGKAAKNFISYKESNNILSVEQKTVDEKLAALMKKATDLKNLFNTTPDMLKLDNITPPVYSLAHNQKALQKLALIEGKVKEYVESNNKFSYHPPNQV